MSEISLEDVREALAHLYDPEALSQCRIPRLASQGAKPVDAVSIGRIVRRALLDAMNQLKPAGSQAPSASHYRAHECITLRYVSRLSAEEIADELSLSKRQVYRDLRWGEQRLADLLQSWLADYSAARQDPLGHEIKALVGKAASLDLAASVRAAASAVQPLANARGVRFIYSVPDRPIQVRASPGILREVLTQIFSALAQSMEDVRVVVRLEANGDQACVAFPVACPERLARADLLQSALRIASAQGFEYDLTGGELGRLLQIRLPVLKHRKLLVIEDNAAVFALYRRYLEGSDWEAVLAPNPQQAGQLAAEGVWHAILLDIMMPETDGWSVLQELRLNPKTRPLPVVVCSVVNDPELGRALGAAAYLVKPVDREALLGALDQVARPGSPDPVPPVRGEGG